MNAHNENIQKVPLTPEQKEAAGRRIINAMVLLKEIKEVELLVMKVLLDQGDPDYDGAAMAQRVIDIQRQCKFDSAFESVLYSCHAQATRKDAATDPERQGWVQKQRFRNGTARRLLRERGEAEVDRRFGRL